MRADLFQPIHTGDLITAALSRDRERLVVIGETGERMTAGQLADGISRLQQYFEALDPPPRRAAVLAKNRLDLLPLTNAASFAGIVITSLHPMGSLEDFLYVLQDAGIDTLIYDADHFEALATTLKARAGLRYVFAMGEGEAGPNIIAAARAYQPRPLVAPRGEPDALFRIAYSGGTTGKPKGIMVTNRSAVTSNIIQMMSWEWPKDIRHLICAPLSHSGASVLTPILTFNGFMVVLPGFDPVGVMRAIEEHRITSVLLVPTMVIALLDHPRFAEFDLSSLEIIYYGASSFPTARLKQAIQTLGPIFFQFYGQSEAPMSITLLRRDEHDIDDPLRLSSCGRPSPLVHVALLDDDNLPVADGQPGEICVRGPLLMGGYLNKPEETAKVFEGGWLHTGDVAVRNPDGFLRIVDRKKDMIISGGFNVFAREVEDAISEYPGVRQAAVIGVPDEKWGEAVKAIVVLQPGAVVDAYDLIASVRAKKGAVQAPKSVDFVDALPLSPLGKPDKKALRARYTQPS
jgi:fatty-acyl-CoA synthase